MLLAEWISWVSVYPHFKLQLNRMDGARCLRSWLVNTPATQEGEECAKLAPLHSSIPALKTKSNKWNKTKTFIQNSQRMRDGGECIQKKWNIQETFNNTDGWLKHIKWGLSSTLLRRRCKTWRHTKCQSYVWSHNGGRVCLLWFVCCFFVFCFLCFFSTRQIQEAEWN